MLKIIKKKKIKSSILWFIIGIFVSSFISGIFGFTLIDPIISVIKNHLYPPIPSVRIDPIPNPIPKDDGSYIIRVNLINNGTEILENIWIDYKLKCITNETKRVYLYDKTFLRPDEGSYFEIETTKINPNCSISGQPAILKFYMDEEGKEYLKIENSTSEVCMYCPLEINITADNFAYDYVYWYPYFEGEIELTGYTGTNNNFLPYDKAENKDELIYIPEKDIMIFPLDFSTACLRGEDLAWCREFYKIK